MLLATTRNISRSSENDVGEKETGRNPILLSSATKCAARNNEYALLNKIETGKESAEAIGDGMAAGSENQVFISTFIRLRENVASCSMTRDMLLVVGLCLWPALDFLLDVFLALPQFFQNNLLEYFVIQTAAILFGSLIGFHQFVHSQQLWERLRQLPVWLRILVLMGLGLVFPCAPFIVIAVAIAAYILGNHSVLDECRKAIHDVASGELFECMVGLVVQGLGLLDCSLRNLLWSIGLGCLTAAWGTLMFESTRHSLKTVSLDTPSKTHIVTLVSGPMADKLRLPMRTLLMFSYRLSEVISNVSLHLLFHFSWHDGCKIHAFSRTFSLAGLLLYGVQLLTAVTLSRAATRKIMGSWVLLAPFNLPLPLFDAFFSISGLCCARVLSQLLTCCSALAACWWPAQAGSLPISGWTLLLRITGLTSGVTWLLLAVVRAFPLQHEDQEAKSAAKEASQLCQNEKASITNPDLFLGATCPLEEHPQAKIFQESIQAFYVGRLPSRSASPKYFGKQYLFWVPGESLGYGWLEALLKLSGKAWYEAGLGEGKIALWPTGDMLGFHYARSLKEFTDLRRCAFDLPGNSHVRDEDLWLSTQILGNLTHWHLNLESNSRITDCGLQKSANELPRLTHWDLKLTRNSMITDDGLEKSSQAHPNLVHWDLDLHDNSKITDFGLESSAKALPNLKSWHLDLSCNVNITDAGLERSARAYPLLTHWVLNLGVNTKISDSGLEKSAKAFTLVSHWLLNLRTNSRITDAGLEKASTTMQHLKHWDLNLWSNSQITDAGLENSAKAFPHLAHWGINLNSNFQISDAGLEKTCKTFKHLTHWILYLRTNHKITDSGLERCAQALPNLIHWDIDLQGAMITSAGLEKSAVAFPNLKHWYLNLTDNATITDSGLENSAANFRHLTHWALNLWANSKITDSSLEKMGRTFTNLTHWTINLRTNHNISDVGLMNVAKALPHVKQWSLNLRSNSKITDAGLEGAALSLPNLAHWDLDLGFNTQITDRGIDKSARGLPNLLTWGIDLEGNASITDAGLLQGVLSVHDLVNLELNLKGNKKITDRGLDEIRTSSRCSSLSISVCGR